MPDFDAIEVLRPETRFIESPRSIYRSLRADQHLDLCTHRFSLGSAVIGGPKVRRMRAQLTRQERAKVRQTMKRAPAFSGIWASAFRRASRPTMRIPDEFA